MYCGSCLNYQYQENISNCQKDPGWLCPYCRGICFCTRCNRQDELTKFRALMFINDRSLDNLSGSESILDQLIADNWRRMKCLIGSKHALPSSTKSTPNKHKKAYPEPTYCRQRNYIHVDTEDELDQIDHQMLYKKIQKPSLNGGNVDTTSDNDSSYSSGSDSPEESKKFETMTIIDGIQTTPRIITSLKKGNDKTLEE